MNKRDVMTSIAIVGRAPILASYVAEKLAYRRGYKQGVNDANERIIREDQSGNFKKPIDEVFKKDIGS